MKYNDKNQRGFTLVELSIILVTISIGIASSLSIGQAKRGIKEQLLSAEEMVDATNIIELYYTRHDVLPCPSDATRSFTEASAGVSISAAGGSCDSATTRSLSLEGGAKLAVGMLPYNTLGIPASQAIDTHGNRLTYAVVQGLTNSETHASTAADIEIQDDKGGTIEAAAAYVIISHGKNGDGAYPYYWNGSRKIVAGDVGTISADIAAGKNLEAKNHDLTDAVDKIFALTRSPLNGFDDHVSYGLKKTFATEEEAEGPAEEEE